MLIFFVFVKLILLINKQFDMLGIFLFVTGMILRHISLFKNEEYFRAARYNYIYTNN